MKKLIFVSFILFISFVVEAQITFQKTFGLTGKDEGRSVRQTTDGGYIIIGYTGVAEWEVYLIKTDANGNLLWTKLFGGIYDDLGYSVEQTSDGGFIICGETFSFGAGSTDVYLIKTDSTGNPLWSKTFGGPSSFYDRGHSVQQTTDGGYIIIGDHGGGYGYVYLIKTDANGDSLWTKTFGGANGIVGYYGQQTTDGGYIITGDTHSFGAGNGDVYLIKTDANGDSLWTKTFGGTNSDVAYFVQQTADGGYIITGHTYSFGAGNRDVYLIKTDNNGNLLWSKTFGGTGYDGGNSVQQTTDGGYIIAGYYQVSQNNNQVYLIKTDANGDSLWTKIFGGNSFSRGYSVRQTADGGYIIAGFTWILGLGSSDVYLIKTDSLGNSGCIEDSPATIVTTPATQVTSPAAIVNSFSTTVTTPAVSAGTGGIVTTLCTSVGIKEVNNEEELILFPNPFTDKLNITAERNEPVEITLFDVTARKIFNQSFTNSISINTEQLAKGIYIYEVRNKNGVVKKGKVVKE